MIRARLPPDHVGIAALIGTRAVAPQQADSTRVRQPRGAAPGLVNMDARELWEAIAAGEFPAPARGPWGVAWKLDDVYHWRRHHQ